MAMSASYRPVAANFFAARGSSKAPGTWTTSTFSLLAPARLRASTAAASMRSVMKLLKRLTTMPKRRPTAVSSPLIEAGCSFSAIRSSLFAFEVRFPFLEESFGAFAHIFRRAGKPKQSCFQKQAFFLRHLDAALDSFDGVLHRKRSIGDDFLGHGFGGGKKLRRFVNAIDQANALGFFRGNHFASEAEFVRDALAAEPREPLRAAVTGDDAELHFGLPELGGLAGQANRAGERKLATATESEAVDRANGRLAERFEEMEDALAEERKIFAIHRGALG